MERVVSPRYGSGARFGGARSRRGGVPTRLAPARPPQGAGQMALALDEASPRTVREPLPGVVLVPDWLDPNTQQALVADFRRWAEPPAGLRHPRMPTGHLMSVQSVCLGWHWQPYRYTETADDTDGAPVKPMPPALVALARRAVAAAYGEDSVEADTYAPDAALVNLYAPGARLGLHQDAEEIADAPVVTLSLGDDCTFRLAGVDRRSSPFVDLELRSGDLLVFGRAHRRIFHGVPKVRDAARAAWARSATGPAQHHGARDRAAVTVARPPFECVVADHGEVVLRVCRALLGPADADDAWSETFLAALRAYPDLRPDSNVRGWLVTIAHHKAIDVLRRRARRPYPSGSLPDRQADGAADGPATGLDDDLRAVLEALAPKQQAAVVYRYLADLPYEEVARLLDSTPAAARRAAADGIAALRAALPDRSSLGGSP